MIKGQNNSVTPLAKRKISIGVVVIVSAVFFFSGVLLASKWNDIAPYLGFNVSQKDTNSTLDWSPLNEVYAKLVQYYDGDIDKTTIITGAKEGMVNALGDKYTVFMDKTASEEFNDSLHGKVGGGIGIEFGERGGYPTIIRTLPDNPARESGLLAGDIIYAVDGEEVWTLDTDTIANKTRGEIGTEVNITIVRNGEKKDFKMMREEINNVSAYYEIKSNTAIITVTRFDTDTATIVTKAAKEAVSKNVDKVILDLRNNGGGYVSVAKEILSLWIDGEIILYQKSSKIPDEVTYAGRGKAILKDKKTVVLINGSTASASEITAGALRDYKLAQIVGEKSFGKGVVQQLFKLSESSELKITTASWYTPLGSSIHNEGITPDIEVVNSYDDINNFRDPQMDKALSL